MMILVGDFNEKDLETGADKKAVEKAKQETGLEFTETKIIKKNGKQYLRIWVCGVDEFTLDIKQISKELANTILNERR